MYLCKHVFTFSFKEAQRVVTGTVPELEVEMGCVQGVYFPFVDP